MTVTQVLELIVGAGGAGGLVKMIATLARIAVSLEQLTEKVDGAIGDMKEINGKVEEHQSRLDRAGL